MTLDFHHLTVEQLVQYARDNKHLADSYAVEEPCLINRPYHHWQHRTATGASQNTHGCCHYRSRLAQMYRREIARRRKLT